MDWLNNCFAEAPQLVTALVHHVTTLFSTLRDDQIENREEDVVINVNGAVRDVGVSHTPPISAQATSSFNIESSSRSLSPFEAVVSNGNAHEVRDPTVDDMSDTASLLPQTPIAGQATSSSQIQHSRNLPQEGGQNSSGVANVGLGVPSHSGQPPRLIVGRGIDIEAKEVANWATMISAGGIFSVLSGVIGNEDAVLMHSYFFKAFVILCYVSFASGLGLHILIKMSPETRGYVMIVKLTIYFTIVSLASAVSSAICILLPSKVGVVVILIVIGLVAILGRVCRDQRPSV